MRSPLPLRVFVLRLLSEAVIFAAEQTPARPDVSLSSAGAPGSAARMGEPETTTGTNVTNIHHPSLTVYLPAKEKATGCAVIVAPGGGHVRLAIQDKGHVVAE